MFFIFGRFNSLNRRELKRFFCCPPYGYAGVFAADAVFYWSVKDEIEIG
nr:MAG TPA: DNA binding protein [Caudoviricetes sp.]